MNNTPKKLSAAQIGFLHKVIDGGNRHVCTTLEMLTGQSVDQHSVRTQVIPGVDAMELLALMDLDPGPGASVISSVHGDVEGNFLFLQTRRDFQTLSQVMGPTLIGGARRAVNGAEDHSKPDWLIEQRHQDLDSRELQAQMLDTITEMGNVLFGIYLTAFYSDCKLTAFQDVPTASLVDDPQSLLMKTLSWKSRGANIAFVIEIDYVIAQKTLKAWLLMLPLMSGLRAMFDSMDTANFGVPSTGRLSRHALSESVSLHLSHPPL